MLAFGVIFPTGMVLGVSPSAILILHIRQGINGIADSEESMACSRTDLWYHNGSVGLLPRAPP